MRKTELAARIALLLLSIAVCLVILEIILAVWLPQKPTTDYRYFDEMLAWRYRPSANLTIKNYYDLDQKPLVMVAQTNSRGFVDDEIPFKNPSDSPRILVLGDSFTSALQVYRQERFTDVMESNLKSMGHSVDVINTGVDEYGTYQEIAYYLIEGFKYEPDIVVLAFYVGNDFFDNCDESRGIFMGYDKDFWYRIEPKKMPAPYSVKRFLNSMHTYWLLVDVSFVPVVREALSKTGLVKTTTKDFQELYKPNAQGKVAMCINATLDVLTGFSRLLDARNQSLVVFVIPDKKQTHDDKFAEYAAELGLDPEGLDAFRLNMQLDALSQDGVLVLDMLPVLNNRTDRDFYFEHDHHWNRRTHELAGLTLSSYMLANQGLTSRLQ